MRADLIGADVGGALLASSQSALTVQHPADFSCAQTLFLHVSFVQATESSQSASAVQHPGFGAPWHVWSSPQVSLLHGPRLLHSLALWQQPAISVCLQPD